MFATTTIDMRPFYKRKWWKPRVVHNIPTCYVPEAPPTPYDLCGNPRTPKYYDEEDIEMVMHQTLVTRKEAIETIEKYDGDIIKAIIKSK